MHRVKLLSNSFAPANVTKSVTVCVGIHILPRSCHNHGRCCISCQSLAASVPLQISLWKRAFMWWGWSVSQSGTEDNLCRKIPAGVVFVFNPPTVYTCPVKFCFLTNFLKLWPINTRWRTCVDICDSQRAKESQKSVICYLLCHWKGWGAKLSAVVVVVVIFILWVILLSSHDPSQLCNAPKSESSTQNNRPGSRSFVHCSALHRSGTSVATSAGTGLLAQSGPSWLHRLMCIQMMQVWN